MSSERLLKPREFCKLVGISYQTFKRWVREGRTTVICTLTGRIRVLYSEQKQEMAKNLKPLSMLV